MEKSPSGTRLRSCRACGKKFEYPVKGSLASRHHCEDCVNVPEDMRKVLERLASRIQQLENALKRLQDKPPSPPSTQPAGAAAVPPPGMVKAN